jgi:uncharacterized membrane protein YgcG
MKRNTILFFAATLVAASSFGQAPVEYRFESVRSKVTVASAATETRAATGSVAYGGDRIRTGWLGYALLGAPRFGVRFEVFGGSDVRLTSDTPGVLVSLERGRLKAIFDKITGDEPRMVKTPGALLAVRGTRYGIEVGRDGTSTLAVFEGVVEVRSPLRPEPLLVRAGETCHFSTSMRPEAMPMPHGMNEGSWQRHGSGMSGSMDGMSGGRGMDGGGGTHGGGQRPTTGSGHHGGH